MNDARDGQAPRVGGEPVEGRRVPAGSPPPGVVEVANSSAPLGPWSCGESLA